MVADIIMFVTNLSSVCNLVDGGALSLASLASLWKESNDTKCLFSQCVMLELTVSSHPCRKLQFSLLFK